jgi:type IV secretory pathway TrbD component
VDAFCVPIALTEATSTVFEVTLWVTPTLMCLTNTERDSSFFTTQMRHRKCNGNADSGDL